MAGAASRRHVTAAVCASALALLFGAPIASAAGAVAITGFDGTVAATLSYEPPPEPGTGAVSGLRLAISRSGQTVYDESVTSRYCRTNCGLEHIDGRGINALHFSALEGNGETDVILELNTGGAHCCTIVQVFSYNPAAMTYMSTERDFGDAGARLAYVDSDEPTIFESADDRFAYAFSSYAYSGLPVQIWRFQEGRFVDVTRAFPAAVTADAARWFKLFLANRRRGFGLGEIAAWAADEELLGHGAKVARTLARQARLHDLRSGDGLTPGGRAFIKKLDRFLKQTGYA